MAIKTKSERGPAGTLTVDDLTRAIKNSIDRTGMKEEEARAMAQHVLNFFGYSERIIDNVLEPEDRDAFYMLEGGDNPLRRPGVADPLLDVPKGADRGARRGAEGEGRGGEDGVHLRRRPRGLLGVPEGQARAAEIGLSRTRAAPRHRIAGRYPPPGNGARPSDRPGTGTLDRTSRWPAALSRRVRRSGARCLPSLPGPRG